jgi:Na+/H+ antiporter NhaC
MNSNTRGLLAVSPIILFLLLYLVVSLIIGDFYKMPMSVALIAASIWAIAIYRGKPIAERIDTFSREAGQNNMLYMVWIFILAGAFSKVADEIGAIDATVALTLDILPSEMVIPGFFIAACFISLSIGTSVGTVAALSPLTVKIAEATGDNLPLLVAAVLGGAFFGDNLSFISDTTIAATRSQGIKLNEKFKANIVIVLPAAVITLLLYVFIGSHSGEATVTGDVNLWLVVPYLVVFVTALMGVNVTLVLIGGIVCSGIIGCCCGSDILSVVGAMGKGIESMGSLIVVTLLAAGMLGVVKACGGVDYLLRILTRHIKGSRGAQAVIATITGIVNLCTANNTVAILTVGSLSRDISQRYGVSGRRTAGLLDTASCIVQCLIPYGAQTLMATGQTELSPVDPWPYLYYPWVLIVCVIVAIVVPRPGWLKRIRLNKQTK